MKQSPAPAEPILDGPAPEVIEEPWSQPQPEFQDPDDPKEPRWRGLGIGFEDLFGRRLPIWAGGITLAVAGMLIVKLSIDTGLVTPPIRVISGLLFGAGLIAAAEAALRLEERVRDPRVRQALAGAGVATLYASILIAANLYRLIDPLAAMLGMAAVTALAMFLATRFGAPSALLGLAGGLAAPALVGSDEPNVPLLSVYLALAVAGLCTLSRSQRWAWLGVSALVGGFGWGLLLLIGGALDAPSSISLGLYLLLLGVGIPALGFAGDRKSQLQLVAGIVAAAQMAVLVATGGFALLNWGLFAMLSIASIWLAQRDAALARLPAVGLLIALLLMGAWTSPGVGDFALVLSAFALDLRGSGRLAAVAVRRPDRGRRDRGDRSWRLAAADVPLPPSRTAATISSSAPLRSAWRWPWARAPRWAGPTPRRRGDARFALLGTATAVLAAAAALLLLPVWVAGVAIGLIGLSPPASRPDRRGFPVRADRLGFRGGGDGHLSLFAARRRGGLSRPGRHCCTGPSQAAIAALFAWRAKFAAGRKRGAVPRPGLTLFRDRLGGFVAFRTADRARVADRDRLDRPPPRRAPDPGDGLLRIDHRRLGNALARYLDRRRRCFAGRHTDAGHRRAEGHRRAYPVVHSRTCRRGIDRSLRRAACVRPNGTVGLSLAGVLATVGVHSLYKQVFAIASPDAFVSLGLAERTIWELGLAALAVLALQLGRKWIGAILAAAAAGHLVLYTLLLHNPLWAAQAVGDWPILNLLLPVYALAIALTVAAQRWLPEEAGQARRAVNIAQMTLIALFAFSTLRQLFHGSLLVAPGLPVAEDILRSIVAIALAIAFLLWGIARHDRDWRIASLVLMLAAVGKVFLFDASGLEGLARIGSFLALGLSLIGIGWLYARHLNADQLPGRAAPA